MDPSALSSSIAALRSSIKVLESSSNSLESLLYFFVALVVTGVVLEVGFVIWEYCEDLEEYRRATIRSPQRPKRWRLVVELLGAALVAVGVAGELRIDIKAGTVQTAIRAKNGELSQLLEGVTVAALSKAAENEREAARLTKEAEQLRKAAQDEMLARIQIEALVSARHIPAKELSPLASSLGKFKGEMVYLRSYANDPESYGLGLSMLTALRSVPLTVVDHLGMVIEPGEGRTGVVVTGPAAKSELVRALSDGISHAGKLLVTSNDEDRLGAPVVVFVGLKPPFRFGGQ